MRCSFTISKIPIEADNAMQNGIFSGIEVSLPMDQAKSQKMEQLRVMEIKFHRSKIPQFLMQGLAALFFGILPTSPVDAGCNDGVTAYERGEYAVALKHFTAQAESGDAVAQRYLGVMYGRGLLVAQDDKIAVSWYLKAAEQGDGNAQNNLANRYHGGRGVTRDIVVAAMWYRRAAEQGIATAQINLVPLYAKGLGVRQDFVQGYMWSILAGRQGVKAAKITLSYLAKKMTSAEVDRAERLARDYRFRKKNPTQRPACLEFTTRP